nr:reverse transcriptase domain-containing protein [Tanacetum cinerariifolium]
MDDNRTMKELLQAPTEGRTPNIVEPELRTIVEMDDNRTMEELLQAPTEGDVSNDVIKLMMFSYSLKGNARVWYDKEPPNLILTWEDLVNKFVNQFFPPSKTTHLKNEISHFTQRFMDTFRESWERYKEMLRACPHHGFTELAQIDTFYNGLNDNDQDSLNAAAGGNLLSTLSSNTIPNTTGEIKAITTQSGVAYEGPLIPTPKKVVERKTEETTDKEQTNFQELPLTSNLRLPNFETRSMLLKNLLEKLGDPSKFLIPCDFSRMDLSLPKLTPTRMTLELVDRSITRPKGVAKDVFIKVGKIHFLTDFVVVDFEADPRVPLISGRSFLRTGRALIGFYREEITLRVNDEAVTFNLNQTTRYSSTYDDLSVNRID